MRSDLDAISPEQLRAVQTEATEGAKMYRAEAIRNLRNLIQEAQRKIAQLEDGHDDIGTSLVIWLHQATECAGRAEAFGMFARFVSPREDRG